MFDLGAVALGQRVEGMDIGEGECCDIDSASGVRRLHGVLGRAALSTDDLMRARLAADNHRGGVIVRVSLIKATRIARLAPLGIAVLVTACGSSNGSASFVGKASNAAIFVQWTRNGSQLSGELEQATLQDNSESDSSNPDSVSNDNVAFTGTVSGSGVTLSLNQGLGSVSNLNGTLNGGELDLNLPSQDGGITTVVLHSGNASAFNQAVASLQNRAADANNQVQQQQQSQAQAQSIANDASAVSQDLNNLKSTVSEAGGTSSLGSDLDQVKSDLAMTLTDEQKALGEIHSTDVGTLCTDAGQVATDAGQVATDKGVIETDQGSGEIDTNAISAAISRLKQDRAALDADRASDPGDVPSDAPSDAQVSAGIKAARVKTGSENGSVSGALSQAQAMVKAANGYANKAHAACNAAGG